MMSNTCRIWLLSGMLTVVLIGAAWAQEKKEEKKPGEEEEVVHLPQVTVSGARLLDLPLDLRRYPGQVRISAGCQRR